MGEQGSLHHTSWNCGVTVCNHSYVIAATHRGEEKREQRVAYQSALCAALMECLLNAAVAPAAGREPLPPMPSSFSHRNRPVLFSTQSLPPVISSGLRRGGGPDVRAH